MQQQIASNKNNHVLQIIAGIVICCMNKAVLPGTFDPPTLGHADIFRRSSVLFDHVDIVIALNPNKTFLFSPDERIEMIKEILAEGRMDNTMVVLWDGLVTEYCRKSGASVIIRGVRGFADFNYEYDMSVINRHLDSGIETVFLPAKPDFTAVSSSNVKEVFSFGGRFSGMVSSSVEKALIKKKSSNQN